MKVAIIGAGPVGLLLANLLGKSGVSTDVFEKNDQLPVSSRAIGVMPPSLEILAAVGLDREFIESGVKIQSSKVFGSRGLLGETGFDLKNKTPFPFILSISQSRNMEILKIGLERYPLVNLHTGVELTSLNSLKNQVSLCFSNGSSEAVSQKEYDYVIGCDGHQSRVRELSGITRRYKDYHHSFIMADYLEKNGTSSESRLYFTNAGAVESFPYSSKVRRWIVQIDKEATLNDQYLEESIIERTGIQPSGEKLKEYTFNLERSEANKFFKNRVILCGDAAHTMSPIGGMGMNTGFADARYLSELMSYCLKTGKDLKNYLPAYERNRKRAFRKAAKRAAFSGWIGTRTGKLLSLLRDLIIRGLFRSGYVKRLTPGFAMLKIPYRGPVFN